MWWTNARIKGVIMFCLLTQDRNKLPTDNVISERRTNDIALIKTDTELWGAIVKGDSIQDCCDKFSEEMLELDWTYVDCLEMSVKGLVACPFDIKYMLDDNCLN